MVRIKHRYIIAQMLFDPTNAAKVVEYVSSRDILSILREKISGLFGDVGAGEFGASLALKFHDSGDSHSGNSTSKSLSSFSSSSLPSSSSSSSSPEDSSQIFVIRCPREAEHKVRLAISTITQIKRTTLIIRTLGISSSGRTCSDKVRIMLCRAIDAKWNVSAEEKDKRKRRVLEVLKDGID